MASYSFLQQTLFPLVLGAALPLGCASSSSVIPESQDASYCSPEDIGSNNAWRVVLRDGQTVMEPNAARALGPSERNPTPDEITRIVAAQTQSYQVCYGPGAGSSRPAYLTQAPDRLNHPCSAGDTSFHALPVDLRRSEALSLIRFARLTDQQYCVSPTAGGVRLSLHTDTPQIQAMIDHLNRETHEKSPLFRGDRVDDLIYSLNTYINPQAANTIAPATAISTGRRADSSSDTNWIVIIMAIAGVIGAIAGSLRAVQVYLQAASLGLTRRMDRRMSKHLVWLLGLSDSSFLLEMKSLADSGKLRAAIGRETAFEDFAEWLYTESGKIPVVIADTGEGKTRFLEGLIHQIYHDRHGNHYTSTEYRQKDRLFPDFEPQTTMAYRLSLTGLHAHNAVLFNFLWHEFTQRIENQLKQGHRVILVIDEISRIYGIGTTSESGAVAGGALVSTIHDWIDNHLHGNRNLRVVGATTVEQYSRLIYDFASYKETELGDPSLGRRLPHWQLPAIPYTHLKDLVDASCESWERRHQVHVTKEARTRLLELSYHPAMRTKNPSAVEDLLEDMLARAIRKTAKGELVTSIDVDFVHEVFIQRHRLNPEKVRAWALPDPQEQQPALPPLKRRPSDPPPRRGAKLNGNGAVTTAAGHA